MDKAPEQVLEIKLLFIQIHGGKSSSKISVNLTSLTNFLSVMLPILKCTRIGLRDFDDDKIYILKIY